MSFVPLDAKVDLPPIYGPYTVSIHGMVDHHISLYCTPMICQVGTSCGQLYILDFTKGYEIRRSCDVNLGLAKETLTDLSDLLPA